MGIIVVPTGSVSLCLCRSTLTVNIALYNTEHSRSVKALSFTLGLSSSTIAHFL